MRAGTLAKYAELILCDHFWRLSLHLRTSSRLRTAGNSVVARLVRVVGSGRLVARRQLQFSGRVDGRKDAEEERDEDRYDEFENESGVSHGIVHPVMLLSPPGFSSW